MSEEVQRMLQEALESEDQRLVALERRLGQLRAERWRAEPADVELGPPVLPPQPPPPAPAPAEAPMGLDEARRLVAESGRYVRELERELHQLDELAPEEEEEAAPDFSRVQPIPASVRHDPARHELGRVFGGKTPGQDGEPPWAQALVSAQERTLAAVERLEQVLSQGLPGGAEEVLQRRVEELERRLAAAEQVERAAPAPQAAQAAPGVSARLRAHLSGAAPRPLDPARTALAQALATAPTPPPPPRGPSRVELVELAGEHQALVMAQVRLLERLIALLEGDPG